VEPDNKKKGKGRNPQKERKHKQTAKKQAEVPRQGGGKFFKKKKEKSKKKGPRRPEGKDVKQGGEKPANKTNVKKHKQEGPQRKVEP